MKKFLMAVVVIAFTSCAEERSTSGELTDFIPANAVGFLKLQNPDLFFSNLKNNEFLKQNSDYSVFSNISEELEVLQFFSLKDPALLALIPGQNEGVDFILISNSAIKPIALDSVMNRSVETLKGDEEIKKYELEGKTAYVSGNENIHFLSNSKNLLQSTLQQPEGLPHSEDFKKAYKAASQKKPVLFVNHEQFKQVSKKWFPDQNFPQFSNWTVLDADLSQDAISLNGITVASDTLPKFVNLFKEVVPAENQIASIAPLSTISVSSITFQDYDRLRQNLISFNNEKSRQDEKEDDLLQNSVEAGTINLDTGFVIAVRPKDPFSENLFTPEVHLFENFREIDIFQYSEGNGFRNVLEPIYSFSSLSYYAFLEPFYIFSDNPEVLKEVIAASKNEQVLKNSSSFSSVSERLSSAASILFVANNRSFKNVISEDISEELRTPTRELNSENFPLTAIQMIYEDDFAHIRAVLAKTSEVKSESAVAQAASVSLGTRLATRPFFFKNHRSNGLDVAVQDVSNTLYLISPTGKIYWKKELESRILGEIQTVDILRNGRYQLALATQNKLHVIDREGNPVKPFPLEFNDMITQPLAIFDYDNNRDYRFLIVQGDQLYMYDRRGRSVKGFDFRRASGEIIRTPKHVRIGNKDYIVIPDASGKLNILSRTGDVRVPVSEEFAFSSNDWYEYNGNFVSIDKAGNLVHVDERGNVRKESLGLSEISQLAATEKILVTISENELRIKDKVVNLDFGLYSAPKVFYLNNKIYVSITDLQSNRIYLFDSNGELIPGFPVFGSSAIDLGNADGDNSLEIVVQGDEDNVLIYEF